MIDFSDCIVLSLFDGISCAQQALNRIGIKPKKYFASEIDKYAIKITQHNYPETIQLGSVVDLNTSHLPKINILFAGSPCQSFSIAGKRKGMSTKDKQEIYTLEHYLNLKNENYEFEGESYLFWEFVRIWNELKPDYFFLENVYMDEKWENIITKTLGVHPIKINSKLLSAQNRPRNYWTNIGLKPKGLFNDLYSTITQPKDKCLLLKDILEKEVDEKYFLSDKMINYLNTRKDNFNSGKINYKFEFDKASCINANSGKIDISDNIIVHNEKNIDENNVICYDINRKVRVRKHEVDIESLKTLLKEHKKNSNIKEICEKLNKPKTLVEHWFRNDIYFSIPDEDIWFELKKILQIQTDFFDSQITEFEIKDNVFEQSNRAYDINGKSPTLLSGKKDNLIFVKKQFSEDLKKYNVKLRKLTPKECERLQTIMDDYTNVVSDNQRYKCLGNAWTIDVICYILNYLKYE